MKPIIHETIQKCKHIRNFLFNYRIVILKSLASTMVCVFCVIIGGVYEKTTSLRDHVELVYPDLSKNTLVYLPESERNILSDRYSNVSTGLNISSDLNQEGTGRVVGQNFVASKNGSRYYPVDCKSSSRIKPENKIYFNTADDAQRAGLVLASGCSL